jgi:predicted permease
MTKPKKVLLTILILLITLSFIGRLMPVIFEHKDFIREAIKNSAGWLMLAIIVGMAVATWFSYRYIYFTAKTKHRSVTAWILLTFVTLTPLLLAPIVALILSRVKPLSELSKPPSIRGIEEKGY